LRLYDELGLLRPAAVDGESGYRFYDPAQLERARLIAWLRRLGMPLARIRRVCDLPAPSAAEEVAGYWEQVLAETAAASRLLVAVLAVDLAAMVFGMPIALFPELAHHAFGGPAGGGLELGLLYAAYPAGVVTAGLLSGTFTRARRHGALMAAAAAAWGVTVVVLAVAAHLWIALATLVAGGAVNFVLSTFRNAITQAHAHDAMRGRIQGSLTVVLFGGPHLANLLHGAATSVLDARMVICAGGLLTTMTVAAIAWAVPELRTYTPRHHAL
jgi:DNA-binding transcriptional MerR regulator